jgi:hypothetical protein
MKPVQKSLTTLALIGIFLWIAGRSSPDADTWWHLQAGKWMVEHGQLLQEDVFSYTRLGSRWEVPGWPVEIAMYWIYRCVGIGGLNLGTAFLFTLTFWFVSRSMVGDDFLKAAILILGAAVAAVHASARPALITLFFSAIFLWILEDYRQERHDRLWLLPVLMAAWANCHAMFAVGFLLVGVYMVGRFHRRYLATLLAMLLAACYNPYGPAMLSYPLRAVSVHWEAMKNIQEWQSPDFHQLFAQPFVWLLLAVLVAVGLSRKRLERIDCLLIAGFAYMGLYSARNLALFGVVAPMILAGYAADIPEILSYFKSTSRSMPVAKWRRPLVAGLLLLSGGWMVMRIGQIFPTAANLEALEVAHQIPPQAALNYLKSTRLEGHLFNSYNWGGFLQWALPEYPLFADGRADLFQDEIIGQWFQVALVQDGWQEVLDRWDVRLVLIERTWPLAEALKLAGWQIMYQDEITVIYQR